MSEDIVKLQNETPADNREIKTSQHFDVTPTNETNRTNTNNSTKQLSSYLQKTRNNKHIKHSRNPSQSSINTLIEELTRLLNEEPSSPKSKTEDKSQQETPKDQQESPNSRIYDKIRSIRLQSVKPELIINMIDEKLANFQILNKAIEVKREEITQVVLSLKKQLKTSLEEIRTRLETKFTELTRGADEILEYKNEELNDIQKNLETSTGQMQSLKNIIEKNFEGNITDEDKYESKLATLQEKKTEIQAFVEQIDSFDIQKTINQCKVRSFFNSSSLNEFIDKIHLIQLEIAGLRGLEEVLPSSLKDQKVDEKATHQRSIKSFASSFQNPRDQQETASNNKQSSGSTPKNLPTFLKEPPQRFYTQETQGSEVSGKLNSHQEDPQENSLLSGQKFFTSPAQKDRKEQFFPNKLLSTQSYIHNSKKTANSTIAGLTSTADVRKNGVKQGFHSNSTSINNWKIGNTSPDAKTNAANLMEKHPVDTNLKVLMTANTSIRSIGLDSFLKQKDTFLRVSSNYR